MKAKEDLYFIAIVPPDPVYTEAQQFKEYFADHYHSKAALKSPPHITLHMPFRLNEEKEDELVGNLRNVIRKINSFQIIIDGFGQFQNRTIYLHVEQNEYLFDLFKNIVDSMKVHFNIHNADYKNRGFKPHLTIAFRDLKKSVFNNAWSKFSDNVIEHKFAVESICILKHNGRSWDIAFTIQLNSGNV